MVFILWIHTELAAPVNNLINVSHDTVKTRGNFMDSHKVLKMTQ